MEPFHLHCKEDLNLAASRATLGLALLIHLAKAFTDTTAMQSLTITTPVTIVNAVGARMVVVAVGAAEEEEEELLPTSAQA